MTACRLAFPPRFEYALDSSASHMSRSERRPAREPAHAHVPTNRDDGNDRGVTYTQLALPNDVFTHCAPFSHGYGEQDTKPERNERILIFKFFK